MVEQCGEAVWPVAPVPPASIRACKKRCRENDISFKQLAKAVN